MQTSRVSVSRWWCLLAFAPGVCPAQSSSLPSGVKENLDLPYDALGSEEEDEEAPEIVTFYGTSLEGDGFFYVIDRSGSMMDSGELIVAKREVVRNITELSSRVQFGVIFFDRAALKYPQSGQAAEANPAAKTSGIAFVQSADRGRGSCPQTGLSAALQMANLCSARRKVIVYVGDGGGTCAGGNSEGEYLKQTLAAVSAQNWQRVRIDAIGVLQIGPEQERFLKSLAAQNGGTYTRISR
jgi:Mg-chelatase subunit ChlD